MTSLNKNFTVINVELKDWGLPKKKKTVFFFLKKKPQSIPDFQVLCVESYFCTLHIFLSNKVEPSLFLKGMQTRSTQETGAAARPVPITTRVHVLAKIFL